MDRYNLKREILSYLYYSIFTWNFAQCYLSLFFFLKKKIEENIYKDVIDI